MSNITNNTEESKEQIQLLSCALEGGCSAKIPPDLLEKTLAPIMQTKVDSNLLSDVDIGDDAGVYKISDDNKSYYDIQILIDTEEENNSYPIVGYKNKSKDDFVYGNEVVSSE